MALSSGLRLSKYLPAAVLHLIMQDKSLQEVEGGQCGSSLYNFFKIGEVYSMKKVLYYDHKK